MNFENKVFFGVVTVMVLALIVLILAVLLNFVTPQVEFDANFYTVAPPVRPVPLTYKNYQYVLKTYVDSRGMVDYPALKANRRELDDFVRSMGSLNPGAFKQWDSKEKIAFWINAYNALTLKVIIDHYPIKPGLLSSMIYPNNSIRHIPGVWNKIQFLMMGRKMTLSEIEHSTLRKDFDEPRIHVALVCAAMACPPLRNEPYSGEKLDAQLDDQAHRFLSNPAKFDIDKLRRKIYLSQIFEWFVGDFRNKYLPASGFLDQSESRRAMLNFIADYLSSEDAEFLRKGTYRLEYLDYDWSLNEQAPTKKPRAF